MNIIVRLEQEEDYRRVEEITREAFDDPYYPGRDKRNDIGCPFEHWMVHVLREKDGIKELSYVAEADGKIAGHVIYSHAYVETPDGQQVPVLNFGPLSVHPSYQRKGIGKALMRETIEQAKDQGYGAIVFFGRPEYYPKLGFVEAAVFGITDCSGNNYPELMAMELKKGYLDSVEGKYYESSIYDDSLNKEAVREYDKQFRSGEAGNPAEAVKE